MERDRAVASLLAFAGVLAVAVGITIVTGDAPGIGLLVGGIAGLVTIPLCSLIDGPLEKRTGIVGAITLSTLFVVATLWLAV